MYTLKRNCNFQTETSFCSYKSPKFPCILGCKAIFLSNKHNNDCNYEQTLIKAQNHSEKITSALNSAPTTPPFQPLTHTPPLKSHSVTFTRSSSQSHLKQKMFSLLKVNLKLYNKSMYYHHLLNVAIM